MASSTRYFGDASWGVGADVAAGAELGAGAAVARRAEPIVVDWIGCSVEHAADTRNGRNPTAQPTDSKTRVVPETRSTTDANR
jgi:hypothetical protein